MEGIDVTDPVPVVEEPEIPSPATTTGPAPAEPHSSDGSGGGGDGSEASSYPWSLTKEQQLHNMKENWRRAFDWINDCPSGDEFETNPWFASVVENIHANPYLGSYEFEMEARLVGFLPQSRLRMTSLDAAILMGDLKMVQEILQGGKFEGSGGSGVCVNPNQAVSALLLAISETRRKSGFLYTPLHLAVAGGNSFIVDELLKRIDIKDVNAGVNVENWLRQTPLDLAWKLENETMLEKLLQSDGEKKNVFHVGVRYGDRGLMRNLCDRIINDNSIFDGPSVNAVDHEGKAPIHYLATIYSGFDVKDIIQHFTAYRKFLNVTALDHHGLSVFYVAVLSCNTNLVIELLNSFKDKIRLNEECDERYGPPIQIAFEGGHSFKDIERALMECDPVKGYMDKLYRDRQVYVDAANAILVGAALIASVTFASWLQPPLNYTSYVGDGYSSSVLAPSTSDLNYVDVQHNIALRAFWVFNALSFYFAIATVVCGARSVLPRSHLFIKKTVEKLRTNLLVTSILLACSVLFVIVAFAIAGTIVLTPLVKYRWCMIVPALVGGMVCIISLGYLVKSMREIYSNTRDSSEGLNREKRNYLSDRGYTVRSVDSNFKS